MIPALIWVALTSVLAFALMGTDKSRSIRRQYRIPERVLIGLAIIGGSPGVLAGMLFFRHKTRHSKFRIGIPLIMLAQAILAGWLLVLFI